MGKGFSYPFEISLLPCGNGLEERVAWFHLRVGTLGGATKCPTSTYVHLCVYTHIGVCTYVKLCTYAHLCLSSLTIEASQCGS